MRISRRRLEPVVAINLVPLIDVLLLIIIFFMVASVFRMSPGIPMNLPQSGTSETVPTSEITIKVVSDQQIYVNSQIATLGTLDAVVKKAAAGKSAKDLTVVLEANSDIAYSIVVGVLDSLRRNNIEGVSLMTAPRKATP